MDGSWSCNGPTDSKPKTRYGSVGLPRHDFEDQEVISFAHESKNNQPVNTAGRVVVGGGGDPSRNPCALEKVRSSLNGVKQSSNIPLWLSQIIVTAK